MNDIINFGREIEIIVVMVIFRIVKIIMIMPKRSIQRC